MGLKGNAEDSLQAPHFSWHVFELLWRCWLSSVLNPVREPRLWYQKGDIFQGSSLVLPIQRSSWWGDLRGNTLMSTNKECTRGSLLRKLIFYPSVTFHVSGQGTGNPPVPGEVAHPVVGPLLQARASRHLGWRAIARINGLCCWDADV